MKPESRRLFFALWPPDAVREALRNRTRDIVDAHSGRVIPARNYHVTLAFIGNVEPPRVAEMERLGATIHAARFELSFAQVEFWPRADVLCLTPDHVPEALMELAQGLHQGIFGQPSSRPFRPHVSLLRNAAGPVPPTVIEPVRWNAEEFVLCESRTHPEGAEYKVRARWPLH